MRSLDFHFRLADVGCSGSNLVETPQHSPSQLEFQAGTNLR
jgi:hypothetical protein